MVLEILNAIPFPSWISDTAIPLGPISIKWYGLGYVVGALLAYFYAARTCAKDELWVPGKTPVGSALIPNKRMLEDYLFYCFLGIFIGGRIGFILLYGLEKYMADPVQIFKIWEGGMAFHGGFLGVCLAAIYLAKKKKLRLMRVADMAAIGAPIGLGLVRLANFANQELYGRVTDVPWAFKFNGQWQGRHPSQLYEAFLEGFVIFAVLWVATRKFKILTKPGLASGICIALYGAFRIFIENFREPDEGVTQFGILTRGMAYSLPMVIIGTLVIIWAMKRPPVAPARPAEDAPKNANA